MYLDSFDKLNLFDDDIIDIQLSIIKENESPFANFREHIKSSEDS